MEQKPIAEKSEFLQNLETYERNSPSIAYLYASIANIFGVLMQINVKVASKGFSPYYALLVRAVILLAFNTWIIKNSGLSINIQKP